MLRAECYKQRMEKGLSFLEFNYMIMQSYDFYYLFQHYGCNMQFGGDDQWSNMLGGTELIRRKLGKDAHAMTITLLLNSEGKKMGKTAKRRSLARSEQDHLLSISTSTGATWTMRTCMKCIRMLTFLPLEQIDEMDKLGGQPAEQGQGNSRIRADRSWSTARKRPKKAQAAAKALVCRRQRRLPTCRPPTLTRCGLH